jgi:hypothetical protein
MTIHLKCPYSQGLVTAALLMLPIVKDADL